MFAAELFAPSLQKKTDRASHLRTEFIMHLLIILILCLLATAKVQTQSRFAKKNTNGFADSAMFNATVFAVMGLLALSMADVSEINLELVIGAAAFGFFNVSFQMLYQIALSCGPTSITALIATLASIVPLVTSAAIYREPLSEVNIVGVLLIIITLVINADVKKDIGTGRPTGRKWFFIIMLAFCGNSLGMLSQQMYAKTTGATSSSTFVACSSFVASAFALLIFGVLRLRGHRMSYRITATKILPCVAVGVILGVFQIIHTYAMAEIPGTVLFPTYSAGSTITIALTSRVLFREKLTRAQLTSLVIGIVAIVLINI